VPHPAADRAPAYGLEGVVVDGNTVELVYDAARGALERARSGGGPSLIEALTYRHGGHSRADPGKYRPDDEVAEWLERDPIPAFRARMERRGIDRDLLSRIEAEATEAVDRATRAAIEAPPPSPDILETQVWADGGSSWRR
jgi:pyruvate dehydrogenase E1 component alpha subunit